ncbi:unnamed protein product [Ectocarpus sp. 13 AM-2016]
METEVILDDVNAVFKPSNTTLVLGAPGSGKSLGTNQQSTLLKALAGLLKHDAGHMKKGSVTYCLCLQVQRGHQGVWNFFSAEGGGFS